jgi:hypothetical protein
MFKLSFVSLNLVCRHPVVALELLGHFEQKQKQPGQ